MKNYILLLLLATFGTQAQTLQNPTFGTVKIKNNITSATATKVNVQEANGEVNTQAINTGFNKNIGLGGSDVVGATTLLNQYSTTPIDWTATAFNSGQVVFHGGKQWIAKIATVAGDVPSVSSKWEEITFEALANKTVTVDQTIIDGSTNAVSGNAVFDGLVLKAPISSVHNPVTLGTANGLSLATQQLSLGLASSGTAGALSGTDWNTFNNKQDALGFTPEDVVNKQNSLAVDGTNTKYPTVTAVNTGLALKANLASPSLTGTPLAPTATAGTNTTQIATTAFVTGANAGNVKLTGNQSSISGAKSWSANTQFPLNNGISLTNSSSSSIYGAGALLITNTGDGFGSSILNNSVGFGLGILNSSTGTAIQLQQSSNGRLMQLNNLGAGLGLAISNNSTGIGISISGNSTGSNIISGQNSVGTGFNFVGQNNGTNTFTVDKFGATTATSFIKSSAPTTNILLAGGGDIAQNTAFNKNFGTTAGTVVEGGTLGSNAYTSTAYLPLTGGTLTGILNIDGVDSPKIFFQQNSSLISLVTNNFGIYGTGSKTDFNTYVYGSNPYGIWTNGVKRVTVGGDGSTTFSDTVTASSYTATSLPVFENNAAASSLAVGQFYRTSIGVLMVKF